MQGIASASPSLAQSPHTVEGLLRENASLRARLNLSDEQRVTQEVLREQLQRFFHRVAEEERASQQVLRDAATLDEESPTTEDGPSPSSVQALGQGSSSLTQTVSLVLQQMQQGKQQAEEALEKLQRQTVAPLHAQLEAAESEKKQLLTRIADLEMSMASTPAPPLVAELKQLRASEALLRRQLQETQEAAAGTASTFQKSIEDGLSAAHQVPELVGRLEVFKEEVRRSHNLQAAQRVLIEELERRHHVEREIEDAFHKEETNMLKERISHLEAEVRAAVAREAAVVAERDAKDAQLVSAQNEIVGLIQQHSEEQQALAQKRQRAEQDASSNPSSIRGELTKFWYEGRDQIRELERQVKTLELTQADLRVTQGRVAQLEQQKAVLADNLAALATEVDRRREEERELRAHCAGVEAERDRLLTSVAMTVGTVMSEQELRTCCATIREAATRVAATSATVVADPHAIEEALQRSQKLKSEVAQLQRQKDQLMRFVQLREDRVRALMEQEALMLQEQQQRLTSGQTSPQLQNNSAPSSSSANSSGAAAAGGGNGSFSLPQFLEYIRQGANDVFMQNEIVAARTSASSTGPKRTIMRTGPAGAESAVLSDSAVASHRNSFVALQQQFQQSQERLLTSHRELLETRNENRRLQSELETSNTEHAAALTSQETARRAVEATNVALTHRTTTLTNELAVMHRHYATAVELVRTTLEGLSRTLQLYHQSEQHAEKLREMVQAERRDMSDLLRREAASWGAAASSEDADKNKNNKSSHEDAQHSAAAEKISAALRQMETYIAEAIHQTTLQASEDQTSYIGQLVRAIREQEERVKAAKEAFEASAQAQASSLVERISAAQQQWESTWKAKYQAVEAERTQSVMQQHASVVLQRALEQAVAPPAAVSSTVASSADSLAAVPTEVEESAASMSGTLQAIRNFITHARQRQEQQQREEELKRQQQEEEQREREREREREQQQREEEAAAAAAAASAAAMPPPPPLAPVSVPSTPASVPGSMASPLTPASPAPSLVSNVSAPHGDVPAAVREHNEEADAQQSSLDGASATQENEEVKREVEPSSSSEAHSEQQPADEEQHQAAPAPPQAPRPIDAEGEAEPSAHAMDATNATEGNAEE